MDKFVPRVTVWHHEARTPICLILPYTFVKLLYFCISNKGIVAKNSKSTSVAYRASRVGVTTGKVLHQEGVSQLKQR